MQQRIIGHGRVSLSVSQLCLGTMHFGYRTDEPTAFAILDRFLDVGGTFKDTANNYGRWHGDAGQSERVLGRWLRSRNVTDQVVVATKVGAKTIREDAKTSLRQLGVERLDLYYAHVDDRSTPLEETVDAMAELAERGTVGLLGASNHATWRVERARAIARAGGRPAYSCVQQKHTYLLAQPGPRQWNLVDRRHGDRPVTRGRRHDSSSSRRALAAARSPAWSWRPAHGSGLRARRRGMLRRV